MRSEFLRSYRPAATTPVSVVFVDGRLATRHSFMTAIALRGNEMKTGKAGLKQVAIL